jgi:hypothetical protein
MKRSSNQQLMNLTAPGRRIGPGISVAVSRTKKSSSVGWAPLSIPAIAND